MNKIYPYAGFWKRAVAFLIDTFVLSISLGVVAGIFLGFLWKDFFEMATTDAEPSPELMIKFMVVYVVILFLTFVTRWLYKAFMESSKYQATLGKMALGIKVVDANGGRIGFGRATGRFFAEFVSALAIYFGFYMAGFTQHRQALHDIIATTYVVDKNYQEGQELPALPFSKGGCAAGIIVAIAPFIFYFGLFILMFIAAIGMSGQ